MPRRVGLPGASELFRSTVDAADLMRQADARASTRAASVPSPPHAPEPSLVEPGPSEPSPTDPGPAEAKATVAHTGRVRHDEKITVYVSSEELIALEHLRLTLRAEHGMAVDRGRIVRAAIASALAAIADDGPDADVIRRLSTQ